MVSYKISKGRPKQSTKFRTIRNFKALRGFKYSGIKKNRIYFTKK